MAGYQSKFKGAEVDAYLDYVKKLQEEGLDPSAYATKEELKDKQDKIPGKGLSTEDFTTTLKNKLNSLNNYDDAEIKAAIESLRSDFDLLVSGDTTSAIKSYNDIISFLEGIEDSESLDSIIAGIQQQIANVRDAIPTKTSQLTNDSGFLTEHQDISGKADIDDLAVVATSGSYNDLSDKPTIPSAVTEATVSGWGFTKNTGTYSKPSGGIPASDLASDVFLQGEKGDKGDQGPKGDKGDKGDTGATGANGMNGKDGEDGEDGATFTPSVDANGNLSWTNNKGLSNPPTVNIKGPKGDSGEDSSITEADIAAMGFTKNTGTVTEVKINGSSKTPSSGVVDLGTVITEHQSLSNYYTKSEVDSKIASSITNAINASY